MSIEFRKEIITDTPKKQSALTSELLNSPININISPKRRGRALSECECDDNNNLKFSPVTHDHHHHHHHYHINNNNNNNSNNERDIKRRASESWIDSEHDNDEIYIILVYIPNGEYIKVIISKEITILYLLKQIIKHILKYNDNDTNNFISEIECRISHSNGIPDSDFPALDMSRLVDGIGVSTFILWPISRKASLTLSKININNKEIKQQLLIGNRPLHKAVLLDPTVRLFHAAESGDIDNFQYLVETSQASVKAMGIDNWTPLHFAARSDHTKIIHYILKKTDANIDARTKTKWTPLHLSAFQGHIESCEILLMYGADPTMLTACDHTAKQLAEQNNHNDIVSLLNEWCDIETEDVI